MTEGCDGDDSRVIVDRVEPFVRAAVATKEPFMAVVWFHAPHAPVVAGAEYRARYPDCCLDEQHYYGCTTAMDEQVGRIVALLDELGVGEDTALWFCSDNGPEGGEDLARNGRDRGVTGGLRGRKRSLFSGGVTVPALVRWPGVTTPGSVCNVPCSTLDYLPTMAQAIGWEMPDRRPLDGIDIAPLLRGERRARGRAIPYRFVSPRAQMFDAPTLALFDDRWKFLSNLSADGAVDLLFDLIADPGERCDLSAREPGRVAAMRAELEAFVASCERSHHGADYPGPFSTPVSFQETLGDWPTVRRPAP